LILKLPVEKTLLIRAKIIFGDVNSRTRYCQDDEHHRQQQLRPETQRIRRVQS